MRRHLKSWSALIVSRPQRIAIALSPALIVPLPANRFPNKLAINAPNIILKALLFVLLLHF